MPANPAPKKIFGQNFLINKGICAKIADAAVPDKGCGVLEIGPGLGALTCELAARAQKVVALEIDRELIPQLEQNLSGFDNVEIICADALKTDLNEIIATRFAGMRAVAAGNLPYYITSPLVMALLERRLALESITVMVQRETAQRFCAKEGSRECGAPTFAVRYFSDPQILFDVSPGSFYPAPNVYSSVMRLRVLERPAVAPKDESFMFSLIRAAFSQRRKTAANAISSALGLDKAEILCALSNINVSETARPESMTLAQFCALSDALRA